MQTFEEVNEHVEKNTAVLNKAIKKQDLKGIWKVAKPILTLLSTFPLIPKKWRDAVTGLIPVIDSIVAGQ